MYLKINKSGTEESWYKKVKEKKKESTTVNITNISLKM